MNSSVRLVSTFVAPARPRGLALRYGSGLILPLAGIALMHAFFPGDQSLFIPLSMLGIVSAALFGGVPPGILAAAVSALAVSSARAPGFPLRGLDQADRLHLTIFLLAGIFLALVAGSAGALSRTAEAERRRLAVTLGCIGDAVISTDVEARVVFMNPAAEKATGWNSAEAAGKPPEGMFRMINQKAGTPVENPIRRVLETGSAAGLASGTVLLRRDGAEIPIQDSAAPIRDAQGRMLGAVMVFRDITADVEREAAWLQAQRLASVGRLAATIAHEINNPLQATSNLLFLVTTGKDLEAAQAHAMAAAQELRRAAEIARQTLTFVRGTGARESAPAGELFDDVLSLYRNKIGNKNIDVVMESAPRVMVDSYRGEMRQVLGNLIGNALDALAPDGTLRLRARRTAWNGRPVVSLVVADTGIGIPTDHMARILEPFFTTKQDVGTGLGLWVVNKIVSGEGGSLRIRSRPGRGTVVRVRWPARSAFLSGAEGVAAQEVEPTHRRAGYAKPVRKASVPAGLLEEASN